MSKNPYSSPSSNPNNQRIAVLEDGGYVSRVQRKWEIFHLFFAIVVGYVFFVVSLAYIRRAADELSEYLSDAPAWLEAICQLALALTLEVPIGLGATYLALKITRKWKQFGLGYSGMLMVLIFIFFGDLVWYSGPLTLLALIIPVALGAMFVTRRLRELRHAC